MAEKSGKIIMLKKKMRNGGKESGIARKGRRFWRFFIQFNSGDLLRLHLCMSPFGKSRKVVRATHLLLKMRGTSCQGCSRDFINEGNIHCSF